MTGQKLDLSPHNESAVQRQRPSDCYCPVPPPLFRPLYLPRSRFHNRSRRSGPFVVVLPLLPMSHKRPLYCLLRFPSALWMALRGSLPRVQMAPTITERAERQKQGGKKGERSGGQEGNAEGICETLIPPLMREPKKKRRKKTLRVTKGETFSRFLSSNPPVLPTRDCIVCSPCHSLKVFFGPTPV